MVNRAVTGALLVLLIDLPAGPVQADEPATISEIVVSGQRREQPKLLHGGNIDRLDQATIDRIEHQHIHELLSRVAGTWIVRGSGQDHQTAIRSPVLSGAGSCGGFLFLEDGIPIRPAGFCTVSQLTESNTEQASSIEVVRGPGNALFGSNALHGIINVLMPMPASAGRGHLGLEMGANNFFRVRTALPFAHEAPWFASLVYADDGGFRDSSGYRQGKLHLKRSWTQAAGEFTAALSATRLRQDSAGFIYGEDAYKDPTVNRSNPNPDAFRDADSQRLYGIWTRSLDRSELDVRPYLRHSEMEFLHHALPGKPLEENGQVSGGVISSIRFHGQKHHTVAGMDVEWSDVFLKQTQSGPAEGSRVQREIRPQGKHYDYKVSVINIAPFFQSEYWFGERFWLGGGLRFEYTHYDYHNRMLTGNTRDDGTACGFGGCLYSRPADRTDSFTNLAPNLSANYLLNAETSIYLGFTRGFRVPQTTELYRLQNGQQISDLDSEQLDSLELGLRTIHNSWSVDISLFTMRKHDSVFRDAEGFNVSGARSRHSGIETAFDWQINPAWWFSLDASYARHSYDFTFIPGRGESFIAGNDIDTAPRWLAGAEFRYQPSDPLWFGLQWTYLGQYYLEPGNRFKYPGHALLNLRAGLRLSAQFDVVLRLNNVADRLIADRADFAAGDYRYLPGRGRELFAGIRYAP